MTFKILLADDHQIMRSGLRSLLEKKSDMEVVAEASNGKETIELTKELNPDIVILDISMPELNGVEAARQIKKIDPDIKIVILSVHSDKRFVREMLKIGVDGYLLKDNAFQDLMNAIDTISVDKRYLCPSITEGLIDEYVHHDAEDTDSIFASLSDRERQVLQLVVEGKSTKQIAADISVSVKTVETHRKNIMNKLHIDNVPELVKYAIREGLTEL
ncbi:response regulator [candidate division KSB1 bacterium]|nr:response regulator [candidate division KSB1 bacterium]